MRSAACSFLGKVVVGSDMALLLRIDGLVIRRSAWLVVLATVYFF